MDDNMKFFDEFERLEEADRLWNELYSIEKQIEKCTDEEVLVKLYILQKEKKEELNEMLKNMKGF